MTRLGPPEIASLLRHRPPALLVAAEVAGSAGWRRFVTVERATWHWATLLDAAAQAAGLCVRSDEPGLAARALVIAAYERVARERDPGAGVHALEVRRVRTFLQMHQFDVRVLTCEAPVLAARVTLAPAEEA